MYFSSKVLVFNASQKSKVAMDNKTGHNIGWMTILDYIMKNIGCMNMYTFPICNIISISFCSCLATFFFIFVATLPIYFSFIVIGTISFINISGKIENDIVIFRFEEFRYRLLLSQKISYKQILLSRRVLKIQLKKITPDSFRTDTFTTMCMQLEISKE